MLAYDYPILGIFWTMLLLFVWISWLFIFFHVVIDIFRTIRRLREQGTSILLVEQNARAALEVASHGYVLETGSMAFEGPAEQLAGDPRVIESYLGAARTA